MEKLASIVESIKGFWHETIAEAGKCEWPTRQVLAQSTVVVIVTVVLLALFVGVSDRFLVTLLGLITPATGG